jgi:hypothetical protein
MPLEVEKNLLFNTPQLPLYMVTHPLKVAAAVVVWVGWWSLGAAAQMKWWRSGWQEGSDTCC